MKKEGLIYLLYLILCSAIPLVAFFGIIGIWYSIALYAIIFLFYFIDKFIYNSLYNKDCFSDWIIIVFIAPTMFYSFVWLIGFIIEGFKREFSENRMELICFAISSTLLIYIWMREKKANADRDRDVFKRSDFN